MKVSTNKDNTPAWVNKELKMVLQRQSEAQKVIRTTQDKEEKRYAYKVRKKASMAHKNIKKTCAVAKLNHKLDAKPWDHWGATKEFLGMDINKSPKELIKKRRVE